MSERAASAMRRWRTDPVSFVREVFKAEPDAWQVDVLTAFPHHQRMAMKACKGPGKSCVLAWLVWNFLLTRLHPKVVCTSITGDNLADGLWTELANWQNRSELLRSAFTWSKTRIVANDHPETWWASARQWAKGSDAKTQGETLAGIHADNVLFVLDEAGGIPDAVAAAAEAGLANVVDPAKQDAHLLIAGNPYMLEGPLYRACTSERRLWHLTEITADPDDPKRTPRVSVEWARQQIEKFGRDNPWVLVNVFGKFPPGSLNSLLGPDEVNACLGRHLVEDTYRHAAKVIGVDVARFGDDRTVLFPRQGPAAFAPVIMRGARTEQIAGRVAAAREPLLVQDVRDHVMGRRRGAGRRDRRLWGRRHRRPAPGQLRRHRGAVRRQGQRSTLRQQASRDVVRDGRMGQDRRRSPAQPARAVRRADRADLPVHRRALPDRAQGPDQGATGLVA